MIKSDVSLKPYLTFGIEAKAARYAEITSLDQLLQLIADGCFCKSPFFILGGGSNVIFSKDFDGLVVRMCNKGVEIVRKQDDDVYVEAAAGEEWDGFVRRLVSMGCFGMECMAAIPGTVGASPVQNVGAYGMEAKDVIHQVKAYDLNTGEMRVFENADCEFGYRNSIFKNRLSNRYVVWSVVFKLHLSYVPKVSYKALRVALDDRGIDVPDPQQLVEVVSDVRWSKLPRPEVMGSAGSFFKNPVVSSERYEKLRLDFPDLVAYETSEGYKLAAGWLIDRAGWKGRNMGNAGVYENQALVLVNRGGCSAYELIQLADAIVSDVFGMFGVTLEKEAIIV